MSTVMFAVLLKVVSMALSAETFAAGAGASSTARIASASAVSASTVEFDRSSGNLVINKCCKRSLRLSWASCNLRLKYQMPLGGREQTVADSCPSLSFGFKLEPWRLSHRTIESALGTQVGQNRDLNRFIL